MRDRQRGREDRLGPLPSDARYQTAFGGLSQPEAAGTSPVAPVSRLATCQTASSPWTFRVGRPAHPRNAWGDKLACRATGGLAPARSRSRDERYAHLRRRAGRSRRTSSSPPRLTR
jgi:hypothetical protein